MNGKLRLIASASLAAIVVGAACWTGVVLAHCGPNDDRCIYDPCHGGADSAPCRQAMAGARLFSGIQAPELQQAVEEVILPKVPQMNLPEGAKASQRAVRRLPNLTVPPGMIEPRLPASIDPRPLPVGLPPANVARELAPQVFSGALMLTRDIDHLRAVNDLRRSDPRLADSAWLRERVQSKGAEAFRQLQVLDQRTQSVLQMLPQEPRYAELRDSLARTAQAMRAIGNDAPP